MAVEAKRGCGYRKVGGTYLVGGSISVPCDRLPFRLQCCPTCGAGIKLTRSMTEINPLRMFGKHDDQFNECHDRFRPCFMCDPGDGLSYVMIVGEKFYATPADFAQEANLLGVSKRIPFIPKKLDLGKTVIYLAHRKACREFVQPEPDATKLVDAPEEKACLGIFSAFIPQRIEKLYWQSALDQMPPKERKRLQRQHVTPVGIPDGDKDHRS